MERKHRRKAFPITQLIRKLLDSPVELLTNARSFDSTAASLREAAISLRMTYLERRASFKVSASSK